MNQDNIELFKLKYYLIPFWILTFVLLIFANVFLFLVSFWLLLVIYILISLKTRDISFIIILFIIGTLTFVSYTYFIKKTYNQDSIYKKTFIKKEYTIIDVVWPWKYLVKDDFGWQFILRKAAKWYKLWTILKVYGFFVPTKLEYKNFYQFIHKQFYSKHIKLDNIKKIFTFDYNNYLIMKQISWTIYSKKEFIVWKTSIPFYKQWKQDISTKIIHLYSWYDNKYKALVLWLLIWDKSLLSKKNYNQFINSWLVHIIVVSGWNIMFVIIFLSVLLFFIPFYIRLIIIWIWIFLYSMLVGGDSSVIRASIMWILSLIALFFWRLIDTKRILWIAFILMLLYNPYFLWYDLWFILSFLAILWILFTNNFRINFDYKDKLREIKKIINNWKNNIIYHLYLFKIYIKRWLVYFFNNYILPTFGATAFVAPALVLFVWKVNVLSCLSSIFVVPLVPLIIFDNIIILFLSNMSNTLTHILVFYNVEIMKWVFFVAWLFWEKFVYFV